MADAIISFAIEKLGNFVIEKAVFLGEVRGEAEWLKGELESMKAFLEDAKNKQVADHRVRLWVSEIQDISREAIAILERFDVKVEGHGESKCKGIASFLQSCTCCGCKKQDPVNLSLYDIGIEIQSLKKRVLEVSRKRATYGISDLNQVSGEGTSSSSSVPNQMVRRAAHRRRTTSSFAAEESLVGFEDVLAKLKAELFKPGASRSVISVVGMGGLGKTTIASKLYHSMTGFHRKGWVCVSEEYNTQVLLQSIIKSFKEQLSAEDLKMLKDMTDELDLERYLRELLKGRRYLLVIDDVWQPEAWESLKRALPDDKNRSRVILTTRKKDVAARASEKNAIHELRFLEADESWDLFTDRAFCQGGLDVTNYCSPDMEKLAREMVGKCRGLPLAIIVLAGILSHKDGLDEWRKVKEHIWRHLKKDHVKISELFSLSYHDLSPELQNCFLYTGMFPEDYVIKVRKLIRLWIAEDLLPHSEERKEDLAEEFFDELINRSLIQEAGRFWEEISQCKVHDLLRDLAIQKAKEVHFFDIYDPRKYSSDSHSALCKRHAIHGSIHDYTSSRHPDMKLHTQIFFNLDREKMGTNSVMSECMKYKFLGVLDLEGVTSKVPKTLANGVGGLIYLRYLWLSNTSVQRIPSSIHNLKFLQTLDVLNDDRLSCYLPPEISKLKELRYLYGCFRTGSSILFKNPSKLVTLGAVDYSKEFEASTIYLSNLQELTIRAPSSLDFVVRLQNLVTLFIYAISPDTSLEPLVHSKSLSKLIVTGQISRLPSFPPSRSRD